MELLRKAKNVVLFIPRAVLGVLITIAVPAWNFSKKTLRKQKSVFFSLALLGLAIYGFPFLMAGVEYYSRRFPTFTWQLSAGIFAVGFLLLSVAAVLYVGFRFLASILAIELQVAREFQSANRVFKNYFQETKKQATDGAAIPVDEEVQAQLEDIRKLKEKGLIKDDEIEDFVREAYGGGDGLPSI